MKSLKILGTGIYLPDKVADNQDFTEFLDTSDEWIQTRTGISQRRISVGEPTWLISQKAAKAAIENANIDVEDIDVIISTSSSMDYMFPSLSCILQGKLGAKNAFGMDIGCACAGFVYAFDMAARYISTGYKTILIISGENITRNVDYNDRSSCILFGDGAGACVVQGKNGDFNSYFMSEGEGAFSIYLKNPPLENAFTSAKISKQYDALPDTNGKMFMDGREVYKFATRAMAKAVKNACEKAGITADDLDLIIPHQANMRITETAAQKLKQPISKFFVNIEKYGNTSSASIPICLHEAIKSGRIKPGSKICLVGFGAGLIYGAVIFDY